MQNVINLKRITKTYGKARGVQDISLTVPAGTITGFLGPNGAGKTTTISMLMGLTHATSGHIQLFNQDVRHDSLSIRARIGFLAGDMALDKSLTGWQQLTYFGNLRGMFDKAYVATLSKRLDSDLTRRIKDLSRGNRQKIGLIAALMHQPELLILDEPTSGLDPLIQAEFNKIILEHKAAGRTAFISSHVLSEVQELCDRVAIVRQGELVAHTTMSELHKAAAKQVTLTVASGSPVTYVTGLQGLEHMRMRGQSAHFTYRGDINDLMRHLSKHKLANLTIQDTDLEQIFMSYYQEPQENPHA